jgi:thiamine biosynthesis protein ThiI
MLQKRGVETDYVFCNLAKGAYERSVLSLARVLDGEWGHGGRARFTVIDFAPVADEIRAKVKAAYAQVILKRMFYRAACALSGEFGAYAIVTGECIGQVSSQTLPNLQAIEAVATLPVLRPLIGFDKDDIMQAARRIGTFAASSKIQEYCQLVPDKPVTACNAEAAALQEERFDMSVLTSAIASRRTFVLKTLTDADLVGPYVHVSEIPTGAVVVDLRPQAAFDAWHWPGAVRHEVHELLDGAPTLPKDTTYVFYCPVGLQSAVVAEKLQSAGYQAYSFRGGARALSGAAP